MKRLLFSLISVLTFLNVSAQTPQQKALAEAYLEKYADFAVQEMHRSGVPASITLAQGMLESSYGRSELAVKANNHFGIQCHGDAWKGKRYEHMDAGELRQFRKYDSVLESYEDHSSFLSNGRRYDSLFDLERTDYKGWAKGLKAAGYAEDPEYAAKLIRVIEMYGLAMYDVDAQPVLYDDPVEEKIRNEEPVIERRYKADRYNLTREMSSQNRVPYVYAAGGETYSSIARRYNLFPREILKFNDVSEDGTLTTGAIVYLQKKRAKAVKGVDSCVVEEGMTMWDISQKYGIRLKKLCKMNERTLDYVPSAGEIIKLR